MDKKFSTLRLYLAQINPTVGDIKGNYDIIASHIRAAKNYDADIAVFPELSITGYPPEDLLMKSAFINENIKYLDKLKSLNPGIISIVGFVNRIKKEIYNSAALLYNGMVKSVYNKQFLPNYSVFDEERYFSKGSENYTFNVAGIIIGINICEDIFHPDGPAKAQSILGGAGIIINISASPYHTEKIKERLNVLSGAAMDNLVNIAYLNIVGGQDELVFDGNSLIINEKGSILAHAKSFAEDVLIYDFDIEKIKSSKYKNRKKIEKEKSELVKVRKLPNLIDLKYKPVYKNKKFLKQNGTMKSCLDIASSYEEILQALILGTKDYVRKNKFNKVVIALSGGIDSALTAVIATLALGKENVYGVLMPSPYSSTGSIKDSVKLCNNLGIMYLTIPITDIYNCYLKNLNSIFKNTKISITKENLQARIRGNIIMALANEYRWMVLSTGNKSEISVGYCTLYGDMAGGFSPIKDVYKTMVYDICKFLNKKYKNIIPKNIITKVPSAELKPDQKDEDKLPPYETLDSILKSYIEEDLGYLSIIRKGFEPETVREVINMVDSSEYKRRQGSPGVKITPRAFGRDRRYPITNDFKL